MAKAQPLAIDLPADLATPYAVPEGAGVAEIDATIERIRKDATAMLDDEKRHDKPATERIAAAEWLISAVDALNGRKGEIVTEQQAEADRIADIRSRLGTPTAETDDDAEVTAEDDDKPVEAAPATQTGDPVDTIPVAPVLVASAMAQRRSAVADAARKKRNPAYVPRPTKARESYLTAAAEVNGFAAGQRIGWSDAGRAAQGRFDALPSVDHGGGGRVQLGIGQIKTEVDADLVAAGRVGEEFVDAEQALEWALSPKRLKQESGSESLLAAGGWCAPSETLYDLLDITTTDGMVDVPGITVTRGGVRFALGPDFTAVYNAGANFTKTEAQAIAGSTKPVVNIPCPSFTDNRLNVDGFYFTGDILSVRGYPEAYADFLRKATKAFAHYVNAQSIINMVAGSTAYTLVQGGSPPPYQNKAVSSEILGGVELQVMDIRYKNRLSLTDMVEVVFPYWLKGAIRSDMGKRQGVEDASRISDADIDAYFALRGAQVQWIYDWQDGFTSGTNGATFGASTSPLAWPSVGLFLAYPQGTWVRALSDVIDLNAVYDSTLLTTNQYVALFMEQARLVLKRLWDSRIVTFPISTSGATGAGVDYTALTPTV